MFSPLRVALRPAREAGRRRQRYGEAGGGSRNVARDGCGDPV